MIWRLKYYGLAVVPLVIIGLIAFTYAANISEWCAPNETRFGQLKWGKQELHTPSFWDCVRMGK